MEKSNIMKLTIVKSYESSATEHTAEFEIAGVSNLVGFLNDSINGNDDIFTGLTYNDPGDETWSIIIGSALTPEYVFNVKTWYDINVFIKGLFVATSYEWR